MKFKGNLVSVRDYRMSYCRYQWQREEIYRNIECDGGTK